jgi:hypothetical protein
VYRRTEEILETEVLAKLKFYLDLIMKYAVRVLVGHTTYIDEFWLLGRASSLGLQGNLDIRISFDKMRKVGVALVDRANKQHWQS